MGPSYDRFRALTSTLKTNITKLGFPSQSLHAGVGGLSPGLGSTEALESNAGDCDLSQTESIEVLGSATTLASRKRKLPSSCLSTSIGVPGSGAAGGTYVMSGDVDSLADGTDGLIAVSEGTTLCGVSSSSVSCPSIGGSGANSNLGQIVSSAGRSTRRSAAAAGTLGNTSHSGVITHQILSSGGAMIVDEGKAKLNSLGFPIDHPFNKEGYRYVLIYFILSFSLLLTRIRAYYSDTTLSILLHKASTTNFQTTLL
ncbi:unnamed protein product [Protopolystoma xenopodis]|uniref:Uncharacterized protein n=1 Tax=Protopolystoma xenopodis TaxID=117903 RepID=A0A3S5AMW4_9PLAT|nr:unnamed protein product [Protopolystoma xenopodis]